MEYEWEKKDGEPGTPEPDNNQTAAGDGTSEAAPEPYYIPNSVNTPESEQGGPAEKAAESNTDGAAYTGGPETGSTYHGYDTSQTRSTYSAGSAAPSYTGVNRKKKKSFGKIVGLVLSAVAVFGMVAGGTFYALGGFSRNSGNVVAESTQAESAAEEETAEAGETQAAGAAAESIEHVGEVAAPEAGSYSLDVSAVAEAAMPSIVAITNVSVQEIQDYYSMFGFYGFGNGGGTTQEVTSSGSGIISGQNDEELLITTNYHVVEHSEELSVCFIDGEAYEAVVKGTDSDNDLAVIAVRLSDISDSTMGQIKIANFGDSDAVKVGQQVVAIGNALGYGQSVTTGILSATGRQSSTTSALLLQTDAAINPGNSGGALLNMKGEVIGINSAKYASTNVEGMGYAIPSSTALPILQSLMDRETRTKVAAENAAYLGIRGENVSSAVSQSYGIPEGVYIGEVLAGSPAEEAGITQYSVLTKFDGVTVKTMSALKETLEYYSAGETVEVTVQVLEGNQYVEKTFMVTLGEAPASEENAESGSQQAPGQSGGQQDGQQGGGGFFTWPFGGGN